jgi:hypothetical protein
MDKSLQLMQKIRRDKSGASDHGHACCTVTQQP